MANDEVIGPRKTVFVLVVVMGCFAVLWPRMLSPILLGPNKEQLQPNQFDRDAGCCEVIFETDVAVLELVNEVCNSAVGVGVGKLSPYSAAECRKAVNDTCGLDIAAALKRNENVGKTTKTLVEIMKNSNSSCLRENFGVPVYSLGPHLAVNSWSQPDTLKQERVAIRGMGPHPALRERGRAIPPGPPPPARTVAMPPHVRVRSPLSVYYEDQPPPIPGMRPPLGTPGVVPSPKSSMGFVMPIYTICIIVFFVYTLSKILFKRTASPYDPVDPDPQFRRRVFRDDSRSSPDKLVVTAISGLVAEVQQQMEASYAQNQQRQDVQDSTRPYTNGTILLNSGPVQIVASEYQEAPKEKAPESIEKKALEQKEATPEPPKVVTESTECDTVIHEHTEPVLDHKDSDKEVREPSSEPSLTSEHESSEEKDTTPEPKVDKDTSEHKELVEELESSQFVTESTSDSQDPIHESENLTFESKELLSEFDQSIPAPECVSSDLKEPSLEPEPIPKLKESDSVTEDLIEPSPEVKEPIPEPKETSPELKDSTPESEQLTPELDKTTPESDEPSPDQKEPSPESESPVPEPKEPSPEIEAIPEPKVSTLKPEDSISVEHTTQKEFTPELDESTPGEEYTIDLKEPTPQPKESTPAPTPEADTQESEQVTKNKQLLDHEENTEESGKETPKQKDESDEEEIETLEFEKQKPTSDDIIESNKEANLLELTQSTEVGKDDSLTASEEFLKVERASDEEKRSTTELLEEALKEGSPKEDEIENAAVKVVGMEVTAHPADGSAWPRGQRPPARASPPPPAARTPHEADEVKSIFLETEIPQQSRVLVAQFAQDRQRRADRDSPAKHSPLVVSGKMTLSLIQDAPRDTPERDPESTVDEFTTASAVTQPAAEKDGMESEEEIDMEIELEEVEEEIEEEEEEEEEEANEPPPPKTPAKGGK